MFIAYSFVHVKLFINYLNSYDHNHQPIRPQKVSTILLKSSY